MKNRCSWKYVSQSDEINQEQGGMDPKNGIQHRNKEREILVTRSAVQ